MYRIKQLILAIGDLITLYLGLVVAVVLRSATFRNNELNTLVPPMTLLFFWAIALLFIIGLYDLAQTKNTWRFYKKIIITSLLWLLSGIIYFYLDIRLRVAPKTILLLTALAGFGLIAAWRSLHNTFLSTVIWKTRLIFAGLSSEALELITLIKNEPQRGFEVAGIIRAGGNGVATTTDLPLISTESLASTMKREGVRGIVVAPELAAYQPFLTAVYKNIAEQPDIIPLAQLYEELTGRIPPFTFSESWFLLNLHEQQKKIYDRLRILIDYLIALVMGLFFIITFPLVALTIRLNSPGPVFFHQPRIGRRGKTFTIHKYRSMKALGQDGSAELEGPKYAQAGDPRVTIIGRALRRARLDELPQFWNILRGEMAFVGPRPERPEFVAKLAEVMPFYNLRHLVKPGITGWAQLHESYYGTIEENLRKLQYDLFYIKNRGLLLDFNILLKTIPIITRLMGR